MLYKRTGGNWTELGSPDAPGPLAPGTQLTLSASGSTLTFEENGVARVSATDTTLSGGAPAIMAYGAADADNWVGVGATGGVVTDDFNRTDGSLGSAWTAMGDGGLAISSQVVTGSSATYSGAIRVGETYSSDQSSQVEVTATQLSGGQWIGPAVRAQNGGQDLYLGLYWWNNGSPLLMLYKRTGGNWTELGSPYAPGALAPGTQLTLSASGSTLTFEENGVARVSATDTTLSGGAPAIMAYGVADADNWVGVGATGGANTYTVGGTVSGLSGTGVLEDNGRDDLSVSANGVFTFATALAQGAPYVVSVKTNPDAQVCNVTNGSGTVGNANVTNAVVTCTSAGTVVTDDFNRTDGSLGSAWTAMGDGGLAISSQVVTGSSATYSGAIRVGETYSSDQSSQVEVTATQLSGGQWIGPAVRAQNGGQDLYLGLYWWNNGSPLLMLYKRTGGNWTELGSPYAPGALAPGTQLTLSASGSALTFEENGVARVSATDTTLSGGAPAIMAYGVADADNWVGVGATGGFTVQYLSTDANGVASYSMTSAHDGPGPQTLRVLQPSHPTAGVAHNFLYVLPVEAGLATDFGDGLDTLEALDAQDQYNLTVIEPTFGSDPWYADNPEDTSIQYETFMMQLQVWVRTAFSTTGTEQNWLIGFSKSGQGAQDLILKHPDVFQLAASWDFPADMSSYDQFGQSSSEAYGTDANFQTNYRLTQAFVDAHKAPFTAENKIWIGGYSAFQTDISDYDALLTSEGILHTDGSSVLRAHRWDSGWVPEALAALAEDGAHLS